MTDPKKTVEELVESYVELLVDDTNGTQEARERCNLFLVAMAQLTNYHRKLEDHIAKLKTLETCELHDAFNNSEGKNATAQKDAAKTVPAYIQARENLEMAQAKETWIKSNLKIFENAHITFRQYAKD